MGNHPSHTGKGVAGRGIDADDACVGPVRQTRVHVQLVGEFQPVIDVLCLARHMFICAVVFDAAAHTGFQILGKQGAQFSLGHFDRVRVRHKPLPAFEGPGFAVR